MKDKISEQNVRLFVREILIQEGFFGDVWGGIKTGVGAAYDVASEFFGIEKPKEPGILKSLDDLNHPERSIDKKADRTEYTGFDFSITGDTSVADEIVQKSTLSLEPDQIKMMQLINSMLKDKGFTNAAVAGAISNAWKESRLNPAAIGDSGLSVGLFQLKAKGGLGTGMTVEERQDPVVNINKIADAALGESEYEILMRKYPDDPHVLAAAFSRWVEKPGDREGAMRRRIETVRKLLGQNDNLPEDQILKIIEIVNNPFRSEAEMTNENRRNVSSRFKPLPPLPPISTTPEYEDELSLIKTMSDYPEESGQDVEQWLGSDLFGSKDYPGGIERSSGWKGPDDPWRKASVFPMAMDLAASSDPEKRKIGQNLLKKLEREAGRHRLSRMSYNPELSPEEDD